MIPNVLTLCILLVFSFSLHGDEPGGEEALVPLSVGNKWTYRVNGEDKFVVLAARKEKVGETMCMRLEGRGKEDGVSTEHLALLEDGLYRYRNDGMEIDPPLNICKLPSSRGDSWKIVYKVGGKSATLKFEADLDTVTVPAGKFKAILIRSEVGDDKSKVKNNTWYAPTVGVVKQVIEEGKQTWTLELEKFDNVVEKK